MSQSEAPRASSMTVLFCRVRPEALNNIARHAKSSTATVRLHLSPAALSLEVEDAGPGFQRLARGETRGGMGLVSMRERAEILHGSIEVLNAQPPGGALVRLTVPLTAAASREETHVAV